MDDSTMGILLVLWFGFLILLLVVAAIASFVFWIYMIIDCAKRRFKDPSERIVWILVLVFLGQIGAAIYYFAVKRQ